MWNKQQLNRISFDRAICAALLPLAMLPFSAYADSGGNTVTNSVSGASADQSLTVTVPSAASAGVVYGTNANVPVVPQNIQLNYAPGAGVAPAPQQQQQQASPTPQLRPSVMSGMVKNSMSAMGNTQANMLGVPNPGFWQLASAVPTCAPATGCGSPSSGTINYICVISTSGTPSPYCNSQQLPPVPWSCPAAAACPPPPQLPVATSTTGGTNGGTNSGTTGSTVAGTTAGTDPTDCEGGGGTLINIPAGTAGYSNPSLATANNPNGATVSTICSFGTLSNGNGLNVDYLNVNGVAVAVGDENYITSASSQALQSTYGVGTQINSYGVDVSNGNGGTVTTTLPGDLAGAGNDLTGSGVNVIAVGGTVVGQETYITSTSSQVLQTGYGSGTEISTDYATNTNTVSTYNATTGTYVPQGQEHYDGVGQVNTDMNGNVTYSSDPAYAVGGTFP